MPARRCFGRRRPRTGIFGYESRLSKKRSTQRPPDTRKHTVLPVSIRLKSTEKTPACVSMRAFLQPISARIYFGKTASHRKRARLVQSRGASPQAYWMSVKAAQRRGCAKRAFCGVCFLMPGGLKAGRCSVSINPRPCHSEPVTRADRVVRPYKLAMTALCAAGPCGHRHAVIRCGNAFSRRERQKTGQAARRLPCFLMVPVTGLEPVRCRQRWILSPLRLPIPSHRHVNRCIIPNKGNNCKCKFTVNPMKIQKTGTTKAAGIMV